MKKKPLKWYYGMLLLCSIGGILFFIHINHALTNEFETITFLIGQLIPIGIASSIFIGTVWLWRQDSAGREVFHIGVWVFIGTIIFSIGASLILFYQQTQGVIMADSIYMIANTASGGSVGGFIVGLYDNRKRQARNQTTELNQKITVLNRVLRHDIRTRANIIFGKAEILEEDLSQEKDEIREITEQVKEIVKIGNQAKEIESVLLEQAHETEVVDIIPLIETSCKGVNRKFPTANITLTLPKTQSVVAHPLIESALNNVVENAIEHNNKPTPEVTISCETVLRNKTEYVKVRIADNGPGIPQDEINVLENGYETDLNHLSGLGLWLVNWIITNSGGEIQFKKNDPEGSIVCLYLKNPDNQ